MKKFADIRSPALAFIAVPQDMGPWWNTTEDPEVRRILALAQASKERVAKAFEEGVPSAHVVRMPNVSHYVFLTNEGDVLRDMNTFICGVEVGVHLNCPTNAIITEVPGSQLRADRRRLF